ncbi:Acyl-CoA dehydrogenase family protein [Minicystis rosea]|nr:Acyl-CoA dehydrogenase family protein [Minicystis rosea]
MNFDLSDEQKLLVDTVTAFTKKQSPITRLRTMREEATGWSRDVFRQMAEYGWLAVSLPESVGGLGGSFVDVALILEQLGTTLVPEPLLTSLVAAAPVVALGTAEQQGRWLAPLASGEATLALAWAEAQSRHDVADVVTRAEKSAGGYRLSGQKRFVLDGHAADILVVSARTSGDARDREGVSAFVLDRDTPGVSIQPIKTMDGHRAAMITLDGVEVSQDRLLGAEGSARAALEYAMDLGAAGACAEAAGITRTVLLMTTDYLRTREQFGVKIGSFQALQHRAVDMFVETELCKSTAILAAVKLSDADEDERRAAISAAKVQLSVGGRLVTQQATQLHGGIGVTDEHDVGLYFKRMQVLGALFGDEEYHVARFASLPSFTAGLAVSAA